jgi:hypothetical protein
MIVDNYSPYYQKHGRSGMDNNDLFAIDPRPQSVKVIKDEKSESRFSISLGCVWLGSSSL